jgi:small redox-active disulfide protein 2
MELFGKKREKNTGCCCGGSCAPESGAAGGKEAQVKILGSGCAKCNALEEATRAALAELGMENDIDHVTDFVQIAAYGVMTTPALVVDGKVLSCGKVLEKEEIMALIQTNGR